MIPRSRLAEANTSRSEGTDTQKFTPISYPRNVPIGTKIPEYFNVIVPWEHFVGRSQDVSIWFLFLRNGFPKLNSYPRNVPIGTKCLNIPMSLSHRDISLVEAGRDRCGFRSVGTFRKILIDSRIEPLVSVRCCPHPGSAPNAFWWFQSRDGFMELQDDHRIAGKYYLFRRRLYLCKKHESHQCARYLGIVDHDWLFHPGQRL